MAFRLNGELPTGQPQLPWLSPLPLDRHLLLEGPPWASSVSPGLVTSKQGDPLVNSQFAIENEPFIDIYRWFTYQNDD